MDHLLKWTDWRHYHEWSIQRGSGVCVCVCVFSYIYIYIYNIYIYIYIYTYIHTVYVYLPVCHIQKSDIIGDRSRTFQTAFFSERYNSVNTSSYQQYWYWYTLVISKDVLLCYGKASSEWRSSCQTRLDKRMFEDSVLSRIRHILEITNWALVTRSTSECGKMWLSEWSKVVHYQSNLSLIRHVAVCCY